MSDLEKQIKQLRNTIFNLLNFTNMYILVLNEQLEIKFANNSLAIDLGFENYRDILNKCWLDFIEKKERKLITTIHSSVSKGEKNWEDKYGEFRNNIIGKNGKIHSVYWFNSHINTDYNWSFSFGVKRQPISEISINDVRDYYQEVINKDRVMINSMRDIIGLKDKIVNSCKPNFVENQNENSLSI